MEGLHSNEQRYIMPTHIAAIYRGDSSSQAIQEAINLLDPQSPFAAQESEDILCAAESLVRTRPDDEDAAEVMDRALKIYRRHHPESLN